nr:YdaS family helix-turn-helix protein [Alcaligenes faecalis]
MEKNPNISIAVSQVGGLTEAARVTGAKSYQTVQQWIASGQVPARFCAALEAASGVSRFLLRPVDASQIWPELAKKERDAASVQ